MQNLNSIENLRSIDPDYYRRMTEVAAMSDEEIVAGLKQMGIEPFKHLPKEVKRFLRPPLRASFSAKARVCFLWMATSVQSFFLRPTRELAAVGLTCLCLFTIPLLQVGLTAQGVTQKNVTQSSICIDIRDADGCVHSVVVMNGTFVWNQCAPEKQCHQ